LTAYIWWKGGYSVKATELWLLLPRTQSPRELMELMVPCPGLPTRTNLLDCFHMVERRLLSLGYGAVATAAKNTVTKGTDGAYGSMSRIAHKNQPP